MSSTDILPKVSVVILNYNTANLLEQLIPFVQKTSYPNFEIIVADNNSSDHSVELMKSLFPQIRVIELHTNLGFAGGYNLALKELETDFWVLLNSDVEVTEDWLNPMMELMLGNDRISAIQPKILDYNRRDYFEYAGAAGGYIDHWGYPFCRGRIFDELEKDLNQYDDARPVFWATGAAMLVRARDYRAVGGMDDDFFAHMEEIDMCWRFHNWGKEVWVCPDSVVYHMGGGTLNSGSAHKTFLNFRNNLALLCKNLPAHQVPVKIGMRLLLDGIAGFKFLMEFKLEHCLSIVRAHWNFYFAFGSWWKKRKEIPQHLPPITLKGWYPKSIVWNFFGKKKRKYSDLV